MCQWWVSWYAWDSESEHFDVHSRTKCACWTVSRITAAVLAGKYHFRRIECWKLVAIDHSRLVIYASVGRSSGHIVGFCYILLSWFINPCSMVTALCNIDHLKFRRSSVECTNYPQILSYSSVLSRLKYGHTLYTMTKLHLLEILFLCHIP